MLDLEFLIWEVNKLLALFIHLTSLVIVLGLLSVITLLISYFQYPSYSLPNSLFNLNSPDKSPYDARFLFGSTQVGEHVMDCQKITGEGIWQIHLSIMEMMRAPR